MSAAALAPMLPGPVAVAGQSALPMSAEPASERLARLPRPSLLLRDRREGALVRDAQRGSERALEELFRRHWRRAHRAAYLVVGDAAAAEDIAQESFLAAIRALDRFDRRRPFGPWLHRITVNRAIDWARARRLRREAALPEEAGPQAAAPESIGPAEPGQPSPGRLSDALTAGLAALSPEHRAVVVLRYVLGYTPGEIGEMLGLPRGTVNSRMRRALDRLRPAIEKEST
ncbi:MAG: RNA polymerase sigma factor [Solirubrobacterales bacterium]